MKKYISTIIIIIFVMCLLSCSQQDNTSFEFNYDEWVSVPIPVPGSERWSINVNNASSYVSSKNDKLFISDTKGTQSDFMGFVISEGTFVGLNRGEWGGLLTFFPKWGMFYIIENTSTDGARGMFSINDNIYFLTGTAHLALDEGYMYKMEKRNKKWALGEKYELAGCPKAFLKKGDIVYILTNNSIIELAETMDGLTTTILVEHDFMISTNSMVQINDVFYVGMRYGILTFDMNSKESKWYVKK